MMNEEIKKELKELAPTLAAIPKPKEGAVPNGYFEELSAHLLSVSNIASLPIKEEKVPSKSYFNQLESEVMSKINNQEGKIIHFPWYNRYRWTIAACSVLIISASLFVMLQNQSPITNPGEAAEITSEDAMEYIEMQAENIHMDDLIEAGIIDSTVVDALTFYETVPNEEELIFESEINF